jgi:tetratricopeptide (TPR) repeat protein
MFCPACQKPSPYRHVVYNKWFTLYFVPLFPTGEVGRVVACCICQSQFREEILGAASSANKASAPKSVYARVATTLVGGDGEWKSWRQRAFIAALLILAVVGFARHSGEEHPQPVSQLIRDGRRLYKEGRLEDATAKMSQALQRDPNQASVYLERGITYLGRNDYVRALADFDEAIRRDPNFGQAYLMRSISYAAIGAQSKAEEDRERAAAFGVREVGY